jgi:hypothetical protein
LHAVRANDRVFFASCGAAGALILLGCVLPTFELYLSSAVGAGDSQKVYDYYRDLRLITYGEPGALVFRFVGAAFVLVGIVGLARPSWWLVVAAAALAVPVFVQTVKTVDYATSPGDGGVYVCEQEGGLESCVGYLAPAVQEFRADVLRKPEAEEPEYYGPGRGDFSISTLAGWQLIGWSVAIFSLVIWFRAVLLVVPSPKKAVLIYVAVLLVVAFSVFAWWLRDFDAS